MSQESKELKLFKDLWDLLEGEKNGGVTVENLLYMLLIIRGAKLPNREIAPDFAEQSSRNDIFKTARIGQKGEFKVFRGGQEVIFTYFKDFYVNRLQFEGLVQKRPVKQVSIDITIPPKFTKTSQKITKKAVDKHRKEILGEKDFDIVSYLY